MKIFKLFLGMWFCSCTTIQAALTESLNHTDTIRSIVMGTGSGAKLTIDGHSRKFSCDQIIKIKGGLYEAISIKNLKGQQGCPIIIENEGLVDMIGDWKQIRLENLNYVVLRGNGTKGIENGFKFKNNQGRAIEIDGVVNDFSLSYFSFENIRDNVITYKYGDIFDGSEHSYSKNVSLSHIYCNNTGQFLAGAGNVDNGIISGLIKNLEISYLTFENSPSVGSVVWMGNLENYNIHHNVIKNVNASLTNHNGIFVLMGNGSFYKNLITNHQGNALRAWGYTIGNKPKSILIYNNIVYNSIKYSGFEVQALDVFINPGKTTFANAKVFNNTCGRINTSRDWEGAIVDVYSLKGGSCEVFNNLGFEFPEEGLIWNQQSDLEPTGSNNLYFSNMKFAGITNSTNFELVVSSKAKSSGKNIALLVDDFYGRKRGSTPSVGAVE